MGKALRFSGSQLRQVRTLIRKRCCNYDGGACLLLDYPQCNICPQWNSGSLNCKWFRYTGQIPCTQEQTATLEQLFELFNRNPPGDFTGHSLTVSDIVALKQAGVVSYHYCDSIGFQELPNFRPENYLKTVELSTEDDYGMIDGIINNGKQPAAAEPENLSKKPSVMEKLKAPPMQHTRKRTPTKTNEKEI